MALRVRHVRVIRPDLTRGFKRIARDADDDGAFPIREASEVTRICHNDRRLVKLRRPADVEALMALAGPPRVAVTESQIAVGGEEEWRLGAALPGFELPLRMCRRVFQISARPLNAG